jgi:uncharacterized protein YdhG (YjbR/CyaY superfamily)
MRERAQELKAEARRNKNRAEGEKALFEKIAEMEGADRAMAEKLYDIITASAPDLLPKTWNGMPAYAKDGTVVCYFQSAQKFKTRYETLGFSGEANLDEGAMWPTSSALTNAPHRANSSIRSSAPGSSGASVTSRTACSGSQPQAGVVNEGPGDGPRACRRGWRPVRPPPTGAYSSSTMV